MLKRVPFSRLLPLLLLFYFCAVSAATEGRFYGARETVYPDWFKESFLDIREDVAEATAAARRGVLFF
jgi:hypothetical protein